MSKLAPFRRSLGRSSGFGGALEPSGRLWTVLEATGRVERITSAATGGFYTCCVRDCFLRFFIFAGERCVQWKAYRWQCKQSSTSLLLAFAGFTYASIHSITFLLRLNNLIVSIHMDCLLFNRPGLLTSCIPVSTSTWEVNKPDRFPDWYLLHRAGGCVESRESSCAIPRG